MRRVEKLKLKAGGWSLEVGHVGDVAGMVAMVCMIQMGVRVVIPLVTCTRSVGGVLWTDQTLEVWSKGFEVCNKVWSFSSIQST